MIFVSSVYYNGKTCSDICKTKISHKHPTAVSELCFFADISALMLTIISTTNQLSSKLFYMVYTYLQFPQLIRPFASFFMVNAVNDRAHNSLLRLRIRIYLEQ